MTTILTELTPEQARFLIDSGQFPELATELGIKLEAAENNGLTKDHAAHGLFMRRRIFPSPTNEQVKLLERVLCDFAAVYTDESLVVNIAHSLIPDRCQWLRPIVIETLWRVNNTKLKAHYKAQIDGYLRLYMGEGLSFEADGEPEVQSE